MLPLFLPQQVKNALSNLNCNFISEIRIKKGQPVIIQFKGEYKYINSSGITDNFNSAIRIDDVDSVLVSATEGCIYSYTEQMKSGFITVGHGIRIGIAGEYVTLNGQVQTIKNVTSLNIRIPHFVSGCSNYLFDALFKDCVHSVLIFSHPGLGKTTMLRDLAVKLSNQRKYVILVLDERNEISACDSNGVGFDLGDRVDIIRCHSKLSAVASAIRAMKPDIILTDELFGADDISAVEYAVNCGITVIASSHICNRDILKNLPFEYFAELKKIGEPPDIYDKDFNTYRNSNFNDVDRSISVCKQKKKDAGLRRTV